MSTLSIKSMERHPTTHKIILIRAMRSITRVLGKLGFSRLVTDNDRHMLYAPPGFSWKRPSWQDKYSYGWGLKEAKDRVEGYLDRKARAASTAALSVGVGEGKSSSVESI